MKRGENSGEPRRHHTKSHPKLIIRGSHATSIPRKNLKVASCNLAYHDPIQHYTKYLNSLKNNPLLSLHLSDVLI
jgi:hypothetical protein